MATPSGHGHGALRRGRWAEANTEYFLTCCTDVRQPGLEIPAVMQAIQRGAELIELEDWWRLRTLVVMRDHVHLLVALGEDLALSEVVCRFKGRLAPVLRSVGLRWQRGYFDHRLRSGEDRLPVFRYVYLNPYRAGLVAENDKWPGYFCAAEAWAWFGGTTDEGCPEPEWLR